MTETYAVRLAALESGLATQLPADMLALFAGERARMAEEGVVADRAQPGDPMPDAELLDAHGNPTSLAAVRSGRPAVVVFYRGAWCPFCNLALRTYEEQLAKPLADAGVALIAISPQRPDGSLTMAETNALSFAVLSDPGNRIAGALGVLTRHSDQVLEVQRGWGVDMAQVNADGSATLPMPTVIVIDAEGTIRWIDVHPDYGTRTEPAEILAAATGI